jgi:hypothetical protein
MDKRTKFLAQKQKDHKLTIGERITVGAENLLHRIQDSVMPHHDGVRESSVVKEEQDIVDGESEPVDGNGNGVEEVVDEESAPREKGRFVVTVKRKGVSKRVAAEVRLRPAKSPAKKASTSGQQEEMDRVWEIQLDCLVCRHPLD